MFSMSQGVNSWASCFQTVRGSTRARFPSVVMTRFYVVTVLLASLLAGANGVALDAHSIQPYYAGRVAAAAGMLVEIETREREVELKAA